jgi:hypothetical protein
MNLTSQSDCFRLPNEDAAHVDPILIPVPEPYNFPEDYPKFGEWVPKEALVDNWAASEFVYRLIDQNLHVALAQEASQARNGQKCVADVSSFNTGGTHVVFQLRFEDGGVWLVRIRFPGCELEGHKCVGGFGSFQRAADEMGSELATMAVVKQRTSLPVSAVYLYNLSADNVLSAPYMMIEKMPGETLERKLYRDGAIYLHQIRSIEAQVHNFMRELGDIRYHQIGRLSLDGKIGPFMPGSPFDSAADYYAAKLAATITARGFEEILQKCYRPVDIGKWETAGQTDKEKLALWVYLQVASYLGANAHAGPFPLDHGDWHDQNVLVDDDYRIVGVIDWELARTCCQVKPSKLFMHSLRDVAPSILGRQVLLDTTWHKLQELGRLFEAPVVPPQFVQQLTPLLIFLETNFNQIAGIVPAEVRDLILGRDDFGGGEIS